MMTRKGTLCRKTASNFRCCWNTGRLYGKTGQHVAAEFDGAGIVFSDADRMISGRISPTAQEIKHLNREPPGPSKAWLMQRITMHHYDAGQYSIELLGNPLVRELTQFAVFAPDAK